MKITVSPEASKYLPPDRVANLYEKCNRQASLLAEVQASVTTHPELEAWQPEVDQLAHSISLGLAETKARIARLETEHPALEKAVSVFNMAVETLKAANLAHHGVLGLAGGPCGGSLDREEALRLRDDLEVAEQAHRIRGHEVDELAAAASFGLPSTPNIAYGPSSIVSGIAALSINRKFRPERTSGAIEPSVLERWYLLPPEEALHWVPFFAARELTAAKADKRVDTAQFQNFKLPIADFITALEAFKKNRAAFLRARASKAANDLEQARAAVASLEGRT